MKPRTFAATDISVVVWIAVGALLLSIVLVAFAASRAGSSPATRAYAAGIADHHHQIVTDPRKAKINGSPAITPHLNLKATGPQVQTFTTADAIAYVQLEMSYGNLGGTIHILGPVQATASWMTAKEAGTLTRGGLGIPDATWVCMVVLQGDFSVYGNTYRHAYEIFNAATGNSYAIGATSFDV